jgi:hypothetical protein
LPGSDRPIKSGKADPEPQIIWKSDECLEAGKLLSTNNDRSF